MTKKSSQPKSRQTYEATISQPSLSHPVLSAFSEDGKFFALVTLAVDKHRLRTFDAVSGRAIAEYTIPSGRVSSLVWSTLFFEIDDQISPLKKRRKRRVDGDKSDGENLGTMIVALGLSDGNILLYSPSHSKVIRTLSRGSNGSAIVALTPSSNKSLWSSSEDSSVHLWDTQGSAVLKSWKNDDRIPYTSLSVELPSLNQDEANLLVAHHHIRLLTELSLSSANKPKQLASFTGHASPIKVLRCVRSTKGTRRFCSAAENDRYIYLWDANGASSNEKPIASIFLDSDVRTFGFDSPNPSRTTLIALSSSGSLSFISVPADISQPTSTQGIRTLLPRSILRISGNEPSIINFCSIPSSSGAVRVVRLINGIKPSFDVVRYLDTNGKYEKNLTLKYIQDAIVDDESQVISNKRYKEPSSIGLRSGLESDQANEIRDSQTQRDVDGSLGVDLPEQSLGQRLAAVAERNMSLGSGSDSNEDERAIQNRSPGKAKKATNPSLVPSNSLTRTLIQALHSSDSRLLEMCLAHTDPKLIRNTIRRLPPQLAIPLINACVERLGRGARGANMKGRTGGASSERGMGLIAWVNTVLAVHTGHLMTIPDVVARLSGLYTTLNERLSLHESLVSLSGRLDTVLAQIETRDAIAPALSKMSKFSKERNSVATEKYVEGESNSEVEDTDVEIERSEDEGSIEDIELGKDSMSEYDEEDSGSMNEFIDDEAEEDESDYSSDSESSS